MSKPKTPARQHDPSLCPTWCDQVHEPADQVPDLHHRHSVDLTDLPNVPGRDESSLEVCVSLFHSNDPDSTCEHVPMVEVRGLQNSGCMDLGLLTASEARALARRLDEAADTLGVDLTTLPDTELQAALAQLDSADLAGVMLRAAVAADELGRRAEHGPTGEAEELAIISWQLRQAAEVVLFEESSRG